MYQGLICLIKSLNANEIVKAGVLQANGVATMDHPA